MFSWLWRTLFIGIYSTSVLVLCTLATFVARVDLLNSVNVVECSSEEHDECEEVE